MSSPKPGAPRASPTPRRLNSWKEIAAHLGVAVRTVQRWETSEDLPVRRHQHAKISSAYAYADELDRWWDSRPARGSRRTSGRDPGLYRQGVGIAVLPFVNLNRDLETEVLSDGLTEDLITALSGFETLRVVARSSAFYFKGKSRDVREIASRLGVENVLEGSVRRSGKRLRVTAQLVSAADGCHLWARRFDYESPDPFELQDQLTQAIMAGLRVHLSRVGREHRASRDIEAYNAFLRGRFLWNQRTPDSLNRALACFAESIARDPNFAQAHAGVAECQVFRWVYDRVPWREVVSEAEAAVSRALRIDSTLGDAHTALGLVRIASFDLAGSDAAFSTALESNPGDHRARHWRAMVLASLGRCEEAMGEVEHALELDPLGVTINQDVGRILYLQRRFDEAIVRLRHTLEIAPKTRWARIYLALACMHIGAYEEAIEAAGAEPALGAIVRGRMMADMGSIRKELEASRKAPRSFTWRAVLELELGQEQEAIRSLQRAAERFESDFLDLCPRRQPLFDGLQGQPEFDLLLPT